jgi:NhaP-type Na+/H+ or K+/H+ antiporter
MGAIIVYSAVLLVAALVSQRAERTLLSTSVIFLVAGCVFGRAVLGIVDADVGDARVAFLVDAALFAVLFTDGMRVDLAATRQRWRAPAAALALGLPLTIAATAVLARLLTGVPWTSAWLIGALLSPTDPAFAAAIVGRDEIPFRLRDLLNIESGLNDGLALPVVVLLLSIHGPPSTSNLHLALELVGGVAIGLVLPVVAMRLESAKGFAVSDRYEPIIAIGVGLLVFSVTKRTGANAFLGAFTAGVTMRQMNPKLVDAFRDHGEVISELLKLAAVLVFGSFLTTSLLTETTLLGYVFVACALFVVRPLILELVLIGVDLDQRERLAAAWFGPKGLAALAYSLLILKSGTAGAPAIFRVAALVITASMVLHSSTDVLVARRFDVVDDR